MTLPTKESIRPSVAPLPPALAILDMVGTWRLTQAMYVATKLGLADHIGGEPVSIKVLADATHTHEPSLYRLLRALSSIGIFREGESTSFISTELSRYLRTDQQGSMRDLVLYMLSSSERQAWGHLEYSILTGEPAYMHVHGTDAWTYLALHNEEYTAFNGAMTALSNASNTAILQAYDFSSVHTLIDVGGGRGRLMSTILSAYPTLTGILFDSLPVIEEAKSVIRAEHLEGRCRLLSGSFFTEIPTGGDAYLLKHVLHDWNDSECATILSTCRKAMATNAKLLIVEQILPPMHIPVNAASADLSMLVDTGGRERTEDEYSLLLQANGFAVTSVLPTRGLTCIIEGVAV